MQETILKKMQLHNGLHPLPTLFVEGIAAGALGIIEGGSRTGKSTLCRQIAYDVLHNQPGRVVYYSSDCNATTIADYMAVQKMNVTADVLSDRFRVYRTGTGRSTRSASEALEALKKHVSSMLHETRLVIVDSPGRFLAGVTPQEQKEFMASCNEFCGRGRSIVMVLDRHAVDEEVRAYARGLTSCYLLNLRRLEA